MHNSINILDYEAQMAISIKINNNLLQFATSEFVFWKKWQTVLFRLTWIWNAYKYDNNMYSYTVTCLQALVRCGSLTLAR